MDKPRRPGRLESAHMSADRKRPAAGGREQLLAEARRRAQTYRERALKIFPSICARCGREFSGKRLRELTVHHKDHNHDNNPPDGSNWELLCLYCHDNEHSRSLDAEWDNEVKPGGATGSSVTFKPFAGLERLLAREDVAVKDAGPSDNAELTITAVCGPDELPSIRALFREYADALGFDLGFQDFETELATLPGEYSPPGGVLLLASNAGVAVGCVALRRLEEGTCEMKRLYVRPGCRGSGLGRRLAQAVIVEARRLGYQHMRLDTVPSMKQAIELYRSLGFVQVAPYRHNPIEGALFLGLSL